MKKILDKYPYEIIDAIVTFADAHDIAPDLLLALAYGESGIDDQNRTGDRGQSWGVFQIRRFDDAGNLVHGFGQPHQWLGLEGTKEAMRLMWPRWKKAWYNAGGPAGPWQQWILYPYEFLKAFWPDAQGSIDPTHDQVVNAVIKGRLIYVFYLKAKEPAPNPSPVDPALPRIALGRLLANMVHYTLNDPLNSVGGRLIADATELKRLVQEFGGGQT